MNPEIQNQPEVPVDQLPVQPAYVAPAVTSSTSPQATVPVLGAAPVVTRKPVTIIVFAIITIVVSSVGIIGLFSILFLLAAFSTAWGGSGSAGLGWLFLGLLAVPSLVSVILAIMLLITKKVGKLLILLNTFVVLILLSLIMPFVILSVMFGSIYTQALPTNFVPADILSYLPTVGYLVLLFFCFRGLYKSGYTTSPYPFIARTKTNLTQP